MVKDNRGASRLFALSDLGPRKDEAIAHRYLSGRYGGVPIVAEGDFDQAADLITKGGGTEARRMAEELAEAKAVKKLADATSGAL